MLFILARPMEIGLRFILQQAGMIYANGIYYNQYDQPL